MGKVSGGTKKNLTITNYSIVWYATIFSESLSYFTLWQYLREFAAVNKYFAPNLTKVLLITNERTKSCQWKQSSLFVFSLVTPYKAK